MIQVELRHGTSSMVGFVESKLARLGARLRIGERTWVVTRVYAPDAHPAWWFRATEESAAR